jgi:ABC-type phosphate transport system substrate-binding protein
MIFGTASSIRVAAKYCFILLVLLIFTPRAKAEEVVVIANPNVPYKEITANALRGIFGMRLRTWPNGSRITVFVLNDSSSETAYFAKRVLGIFPHQLRVAWDRLVYSGTGQAPFEVPSEAEMRTKIASTTDAIGYLSVEMVDDSVRVLQIK